MTTRRARLILLALAIFLTLMLSTTSSALAVSIYTDAAAFVAATGAINIPIPNAATAFPGTTCGSPTAQTGIGSTVVMPFGSNSATVTNTTGGSLAICIFNEGAIIPGGNTIPATMIANTIVGNGEDDYLLTFAQAVGAIGFRFLTNDKADEILTFMGPGGRVIEIVDIDSLTAPNTRVFLGFQFVTPIWSVLIDTAGGEVQNEGIDSLSAAAPVPEPSTLLLLSSGLAGLGGAAWRRHRRK